MHGCRQYVIIRIGEQTLKTEVVKRSLSPTWNAHFELHCTNDVSVRFELFDKDAASKDDALCLLELRLDGANRDHEWMAFARHPDMDENILKRIVRGVQALVTNDQSFGSLQISMRYSGSASAPPAPGASSSAEPSIPHLPFIASAGAPAAPKSPDSPRSPESPRSPDSPESPRSPNCGSGSDSGSGSGGRKRKGKKGKKGKGHAYGHNKDWK